MLLSRSSIAAVTALARTRAPLLSASVAAARPSFARSFSSSQVAARIPATFFHANRSTSPFFQLRCNSSHSGGGGNLGGPGNVPPLPPSPPAATGTATAAPVSPSSPAPTPTSTPTPPHKKHHRWSYARYGIPGPQFSSKHPWLATLIRLGISVIFGGLSVLLLVFLHDIMTYQKRHVDRVPCNPLALHPRRGGPKNLPIIDMLLDDEESDVKLAMAKKPRLVIVGGGWGAVALLKTLQPTAYNVAVVSPTNYFCFTPLLPSACVGTVEVRSLVEPLRKLVARVHGHYLNGAAVDISMNDRLLEVEVPNESGTGTMRAYVPYDKLIIAVGAKSNEHGIKGLEYCHQLKTVPDAQLIRRHIMKNLETASLPTTTPEERKHLLSFVVCGGGPTGVEFAAELSDMLQEDVLDYYPKPLKDEMSVTIIQSQDHILNTYSEKISEYAEKHFSRENINVITNARVTEVTPDTVKITVRRGDKPEEKILPASFVLWSTGIAMQPFTKRMVELLPNQYHSKACQVDAYLRVEGAPPGTIYAIGDAATVHLNMIGDLLTLWDKFDTDKDDKITLEEWTAMANHLKKKYPLARGYLGQLKAVFDEFDRDHDHHLSLNEVAEMFLSMSKEVTALPATAQVASQEGHYLAKKFNKLSKDEQAAEKDGKTLDVEDDVYYPPFKYRSLGTLAYIGNSAAFDLNGYSSVGGLLAMYAWRSVYWSEQVSMRTRFMLMQDWIKRGLFGRDLSKF